MSDSAGHVMDLGHTAGPSATPWAETARPQPTVPPSHAAEDWEGLPRLEAVVSRQRHYMVRDIIAAVAFAALAVAVVIALL